MNGHGHGHGHGESSELVPLIGNDLRGGISGISGISAMDGRRHRGRVPHPGEGRTSSSMRNSTKLLFRSGSSQLFEVTRSVQELSVGRLMK